MKSKRKTVINRKLNNIDYFKIKKITTIKIICNLLQIFDLCSNYF